MTAQVHEALVLNGIQTSMASTPPLPPDNPRIIETKENSGINTACWRGYRGSWQIKDGRLFLIGITGRYRLSDGAPIFADWFTGTIRVPSGKVLDYVHGGFATVYEEETHITIQYGFVTATVEIDNRRPSPRSTNIDYGVVNKYVSERDYGFVRGLLLGRETDIFFHIKTIRKTAPELARLISTKPFKENIHFWFDTETSKGLQVRTILSPEELRQIAASDRNAIKARIESCWRNLGQKLPSWLKDATSDLLDPGRTSELVLERGRLEMETQNARELKIKDLMRNIPAEQERRQRHHSDAGGSGSGSGSEREKLEDEEFQNLVAEMRELKFTHSSQVSNYIISNRLGYKYKNISGILQMELDGNTWNFKGGFPPFIYARLCSELGLSNNRTKARPVAFESFGSIEERSRRK